MRSSRPLERMTFIALALILVVVLAGQFTINSIHGDGNAKLRAELATAAVLDLQVLELATLQKSIQIDVIQVQQFLTDVSATRAMDGLGDGFDVAAEHARSFQSNLEQATTLAKTLGATALFDALTRVEKAFPPYYALGQRMAEAYVAKGPTAGNRMMPEFDATSLTIAGALDKTKAEMRTLLDRFDGDRQGKAAEVAAASAFANQIALAVMALTFLLVLGLAILLRSRLLRPLGDATQALNALAQGNLKATLGGETRADEIGALARAFQVFKQAADENRRLAVTAIEAQNAQNADRDRQREVDNATSENLRAFVRAVEDGFNALAAGDLTVRMNKAVAPEFEPIRKKFNDSVGSLEDVIAQVVAAIGTIQNGIGEISLASGDLSQRTEQQAASLEQTVAALGAVTAAVNETAIGAGRAHASAATAQKNAEKGGEIVSRAITAMTLIEKSSEQIGRIIGVIDEIAFQTNLLALNAGVEAARAGEAGRGFAVVAQEVRGLAQRSAEAAKEIKSLISASSAQVAVGVDLVTASGRSLEEIVREVGGMSQGVAEIARSAREQAVSLTEVSTAADQMDKVTQQNAAMVEETTAAAHSLTSETEELTTLVERFKTSMARQAERPREVRRPAAPLRSKLSEPVVQMRTRGSSGAALAAKTEADSWEEF